MKFFMVRSSIQGSKVKELWNKNDKSGLQNRIISKEITLSSFARSLMHIVIDPDSNSYSQEAL